MHALKKKNEDLHMQTDKIKDSNQVGVALTCAKESKYCQEYFSSDM